MDRLAQAGIEAVAGVLGHYDRSQLAYQLGEIVDERTYLRHGVDVREGDVVLDVGANVGVAAAFFALECRAGLVHSFEPVPELFTWLRENLSDLCELRTLSRVLREESVEKVDLLSIDVERTELDVLRGIEERDFAVTVVQEEMMRGTPVHMLYATRR